jgi:Holliday junction DNA helicase RuvA
MIGRLIGKVLAEEPGGGLIVDVGGVGYELLAPVGTLGRAAVESDGRVTLHVHTHVREDALDLFGFSAEGERRLFRLLINVPNVGPKMALGLLSALPPPALNQAIHEGNLARLCKVPGIGKKTAERLVMELKEKLPPAAAASRAETTSPSAKDDASRLIGALTNMGYRPAEAERAVKSLGDRVGREPVAELLRQALAALTP